MKLSPHSLALALLSLVTLAAVERLPIEDFTREADTTQARLSPDGKAFAFVRPHNGLAMLHVADLQSNQITRLDLGEGIGGFTGRKEVYDYRWISPSRLVITTTLDDAIFGLIAVNRDGSKAKGVAGYERDRIEMTQTAPFMREIVHAFGDKDQSILLLNRPHSPNRPEIVRLNTLDGLSKTVVKNPGEVAHWGLDFDGVARFGILTHGDLSGAIYRASEKEEWKTILPLQNRRGQFRLAGFDRASNRILVTKLNEQRRWAVYPLDPATGDFGEALLSDPAYDIVPDRGITGAAGIALAGTFFSRHKQALAGIRYYTESPRVKWFDRDYATRQAAVDKALPNTVNFLVDESHDGQRQLWYAFSDQHPGDYHLLDAAQKSFKPLAPRMGWIKPAQMAPMHSVKYTARDGLVVHGYLTVPVGYQPKGLPLVVMPHGGPWARDTWGFNSLIQLLANRGYAVLQMNYRGSPGYGDDLFQQAKKEIGGKIQDDIEDATKWAIAAGVADPQRIAIMGMSYGGYSALFGLGRSPGLYRCGISFAGVTDWPAIYEDSDVAENKDARRYWREQIGDPEKDLERLRAASPANFAEKITAPVLIIQGKRDRRVPQDQAKRMIAALEKAGRPPESLFLSDVGHNYGDPKDRLKVYQAMVAFLEKHLGPGVP